MHGKQHRGWGTQGLTIKASPRAGEAVVEEEAVDIKEGKDMVEEETNGRRAVET